MKRFIAMFMIIVGAVVGLWGGYTLFTGGPPVLIPGTRDTLVAPMYVALAGLATFTLGVIGYRD